jgi:hypothetical protein
MNKKGSTKRIKWKFLQKNRTWTLKTQQLLKSRLDTVEDSISELEYLNQNTERKKN